MKAVRELGEQIALSWRRCDNSEETFAEVAASCLSDSGFLNRISTEELNRWFLRDPALPAQSFRDFGQPALTLYQGQKFYIELLYWVDSTTAIHQHSFAGAFGVFKGSSLLSRYDFEVEDPVASELVLGKLHLLAVELLTKGDVREIRPGRGLIHSLFHLDRPTLSLVVRTHAIPRYQPQYSYRRAGFGYDPFFSPEPFATRLRLLEALSDTGDASFWKLAGELLDCSDPWMALAVLKPAYHARSSPQYAEFAEQARRIHGRRAEIFLAGHAERVREQNITLRRREIHDPDHRFFLALLLNLPDRDAIFAAMKQRHPDADREQLILKWVGELSDANKIGLEFNPLSLKMLHYALRDRSFSNFAEDLGRAFGPSQVLEQADDLEGVWTELHASSLLQPLFVSDRGIVEAVSHA